MGRSPRPRWCSPVKHCALSSFGQGEKGTDGGSNPPRGTFKTTGPIIGDRVNLSCVAGGRVATDGRGQGAPLDQLLERVVEPKNTNTAGGCTVLANTDCGPTGSQRSTLFSRLSLLASVVPPIGEA